jgi:hypothetical protein
MIYEKFWAAVHLVLRDTRFLEAYLLKNKNLHDEFWSDRVLDTYHSHIYMLIRIGSCEVDLDYLLCIECCQALLTLWIFVITHGSSTCALLHHFHSNLSSHFIMLLLPWKYATSILFYSTTRNKFYSYPRSRHQKKKREIPILSHLTYSTKPKKLLFY